MYLFHEVHVDDLALARGRDRRTWEAARELVEAICRVAEGRGQRLALRFRHHFAEAALELAGPRNPVRAWEERGHEIGAHAHRRHLRRTATALHACGVRELHGVVPGLIRASRRTSALVLRATRHLGFRWVTDQLQHGPFAYSGLTPWRPNHELSGPGDGPLVFIDISVNPFAWGILENRDGRTTQVFGLRPRHFERLGALLDAHLALPRPHDVVYFGYPFHEHQHARGPDDLRGDDRSLRCFDDFLALVARRPVRPVLPREVYRAWVAVEGEPAIDPPGPLSRAAALLDRRDLRHDVPSWLSERIDGANRPPRLRPAIPGAAARLRAPRGGRTLRLPAGDHLVAARRFGPERPSAAVVVSVSGRTGGLATGLRPFGLRPRQLAERGWAVWLYDRTGTGLTGGGRLPEPGSPAHRDEAAAVLRAASAEGVPAGWLCFSAGCIAPLQALPQVRPAFFIDAEAPADRLSMLGPEPASTPRERELGWRRGIEDPALDAIEPWRLLRGLPCPYHRLQAELDHVHGRMALHARVMLEHAPGPRFLNGSAWTGRLALLPGRLHEHPDRVLAVIEQAIAG